MDLRPLGRSSLEISRLGFGAWAIGGAGWAFRGSAERDATSIAAMQRAFDLGVNWVDTAPTYGRGHSEELVGRALPRPAGVNGRSMAFTKCGRRWDSPTADPRSDLRPAEIRADCERALRRLQVEAIDLLQFHWPDEATGTPVEESWGELLRLREEGKIRAAGVCNFDQSLLVRCEAVGHVDSLQTPLSLIRRSSADRLLDWCAAHGVGVLVYSPMQVGLLTDSFTRDRLEQFDPEDWRRRQSEFQDPRLERNLALRDGLRPVAVDHSTSVGAVAVAWTLSWPQVTGAIVGARTPEQVEGWIDAATLNLTEQDLDAISKLITESGAGEGPTRPPRLRPVPTG